VLYTGPFSGLSCVFPVPSGPESSFSDSSLMEMACGPCSNAASEFKELELQTGVPGHTQPPRPLSEAKLRALLEAGRVEDGVVPLTLVNGSACFVHRPLPAGDAYCAVSDGACSYFLVEARRRTRSK